MKGSEKEWPEGDHENRELMFARGQGVVRWAKWVKGEWEVQDSSHK